MTGIQYFEYGETEIEYLRGRDKKLGAAIDAIGKIERAVNPDIFAALIESIVGQQISAKAAATVCARLKTLSGLDAACLHVLTIEQVQACGMSMRKAAYIKNAASAVMDGEIDLTRLADKSDAEIIKTLTALDGIGVWTAEMLLIFSLMRPNVISYGDLAIRRSMMQLYGHKTLDRARFDKYAKRYAPYASVASLYLWAMAIK